MHYFLPIGLLATAAFVNGQPAVQEAEPRPAHKPAPKASKPHKGDESGSSSTAVKPSATVTSSSASSNTPTISTASSTASASAPSSTGGAAAILIPIGGAFAGLAGAILL
ncbi:hypothetical protein BDV59DRAFT_199403 [Aspergillus ambiguus]|uniref:uncharacterized protein n=1 Tax=Aspergillus ambiguus TaxID=176160 RepID=UPI003CCD7D9C